MAEYRSFENNIAIGGYELPPFAWGKLGPQQCNELLEKYGLDGSNGAWYDLQTFLDAMKDMAESVGEMNLFLIGKATIDGANFPPMDCLETALRSLDTIYHMNHKKNGVPMYDPETGEMLEGIGHYELVRFNREKREAVIACRTPYPSKFEEGLFAQMIKRFRPSGSLFTKVRLDTSKETKTLGGESCTFIISW